MKDNDLITVEKRVVARFMDMLIKFSLLLALASFCFTIFTPFMNLMLWALILAVTLYPLQQNMVKRLNLTQGKASTLLALLGILVLVVPTIFIVSSMGDSVSNLVEQISQNTLEIPEPSQKIASIPLIGAKVYSVWMQAATNLPALVKSLSPQLGDAAKQVVGVLGSMSSSLVMFIISFIVAGIIMTFGKSGANSATRIAMRFMGPQRGVKMTVLCTATIRAVAQGVIGVAFIQALLAGIVMMLAGIPAVGIFFFLALILGIAQVPVILVTAPAIAYMWWAGDHGTFINIVFTVLLLVAGMADNVLKPLLLGRGVDAPMPVVLMGALGGMAASGILGMFIGATMLSIGYRIFMAWVDEGLAAENIPPQS